MTYLKQLASALIVAAAALFAALPANAVVILTEGQVITGDPIKGVNNNLGTTTITGTNVLVDITQIDAGSVTPIFALLDLSATSIAPATSSGGFVTQAFSGSFSITSGGTNYLSGTFSDAVFGSGSSLTLSVSDPNDSVTFTSNVIAAADLGLPRGMSLSFADVHPSVGVHKGSLSSFTSSISGTFSGRGPLLQTPEPGSLVLVALAMLGLVGIRRRKSL